VSTKRFDFYGGDWFLIAYLLRFGGIVCEPSSEIYRGDKGLSSDHVRLLNHYYKHSKLRYLPFLRPSGRYLRIDFFSALYCMDILLLYNFIHMNRALELLAPGRYSFFKRMNAVMIKVMQRIIYLVNKSTLRPQAS